MASQLAGRDAPRLWKKERRELEVEWEAIGVVYRRWEKRRGVYFVIRLSVLL